VRFFNPQRLHFIDTPCSSGGNFLGTTFLFPVAFYLAEPYHVAAGFEKQPTMWDSFSELRHATVGGINDSRVKRLDDGAQTLTFRGRLLLVGDHAG
jgi:hypothetical protein